MPTTYIQGDEPYSETIFNNKSTYNYAEYKTRLKNSTRVSGTPINKRVIECRTFEVLDFEQSQPTTTALVETTSLGANLLDLVDHESLEESVNFPEDDEKQQIINAYENGEISWDDVQRDLNELQRILDCGFIKWRKKRRKRRQVVIGTIAASAIIAGVASEIEYSCVPFIGRFLGDEIFKNRFTETKQKNA